MLFNGHVREDRVDLRKGRKEQLGMEGWRCGFKRIQSETTVRQYIGRMHLWTMVGDAGDGENPWGDADSS